MNKILLSSILAAGCFASANAAFEIKEVVVPQDITYGQTADIKVIVVNDGRPVNDYNVEVYRTFEGRQGTYPPYIDYITVELASFDGTEPLAKETELSIPIDFYIGGNWALLVKLTADDLTLEGRTEFKVNVPIEGNSLIKTVPSKDLPASNTDWFSAFNGDSYFADQCVYPNDLFDLPREVTINKLTYYYKPQNLYRPELRYKIYMGTVDADVVEYPSKTAFSTDMMLVYDDIVPERPLINDYENTPDQEWDFVLGCPYTYDPSKNLVITVEAYAGQNFIYNYAFDVIADKRENSCNLYSTWWKEGDFFSEAPQYLSTNGYMPAITISYQLAELPEVTDMAIGDVTVPSKVTAGERATFRVQVKNEGTSVVNNFTLELLDVRDGLENAVVLASTEINETYGASSEGIERFSYTFENAETYNLAFRIVAGDDIDETNNVSEEFQVAVGQAVGVSAVSAESDVLRYAEGRIVVGLEDAASLRVAAADGRIVLSEELNGGTEINAALQTGVYVARVTEKNGKAYIAKFIVK